MLHKTKVRETDPSAVVGILVQKWVYLALSWKYTKLSNIYRHHKTLYFIVDHNSLKMLQHLMAVKTKASLNSLVTERPDLCSLLFLRPSAPYRPPAEKGL